jgi:hypothetical protein
LARLSRALAMDLELVGAEVSTGGFRTDIVARDRSSGEVVVIENQFGRSDHDHFGKALTYLAAHDAKSVVRIAGAFADEHRAAPAWLNDHTDEEAGFFAVVPKLMRIAGSPPGLRFAARAPRQRRRTVWRGQPPGCESVVWRRAPRPRISLRPRPCGPRPPDWSRT